VTSQGGPARHDASETGDTPGPGPAPPPAPARPLPPAAGQPGAETGPPPRRRRGYWIPGLIAIAVLTAIGVAFGAGDLNHRSPRVLHGRDVAQQIALGIQVQEKLHQPPDVHCPASEPVRNGWRFVCTRIGAGPPRPIRVVEVDNRGRLRWSVGG
jgi:hypothetical protein